MIKALLHTGAVLAALALAGCGGGASTSVAQPQASSQVAVGEPGGATVLPLKTLAKDWSSGIRQPRTVVVKDAEAFARLWNEHTANYTEPPRPPMAVDFSHQMVAGVFAGDLKVPCEQMGITGVSSTGSKLVVDYELRMPPADVVCAAVVQSPMHLVVVERSDAPVEFVAHQVDLVTQEAIDGTQMSHVHTAREVVVRDAAAWAALWAEHAGTASPAPAVDFGKQVVVGIFLGDQPGSCHAIRLDSVTSDNARLAVNYFRTTPGPTELCAPVVTSPALLLKVDRTGLPVVFRQGSLTR